MVVNTRGLLLKLTTLAITVVGGVFLASNTYAAPTIGLSLNTSNLNIGTLNQSTPFIKNTHSLRIDSTDTAGYTLTLSTNSTDANSNRLTNTTDPNSYFSPVSGTPNSKVAISNKTWGYKTTSDGDDTWDYGSQSSDWDVYEYANEGGEDIWGFRNGSEVTKIPAWSKVPTKSNPDTIADKNENTSETINVTYGAYLQNTHTVKAGDYQTTVEYTATAKVPPAPVITTISPNSYREGATGSRSNITMTITITGNNLSTTTGVYIDLNNNGNKDSGEECINLTKTSNTQISCMIPNYKPKTKTTYNLVVTNNGGSTTKTNAFTYKPNVCDPVIMPNNTIYDSETNVRVDYDQCMIPVKYTGSITETNSGWSTANPNNTNHDWFNYNTTDKKWANALTIDKTKNWPGTNTLATDYLREKVKNNQYSIQIPNEIIKGFWVYIPRYAYEVMRPDAIDKVVQAQNFDIRFETKSDTKKIPQTNTSACNTISGSTLTAKDYRTECATQLGISRIYGVSTGTTWATHPAFTFGDKELNGIWVGKFEITGTRYDPTVMPNQVTNISEHIGNLYTMAKSIGVNDPNNTYGGSTYSESISVPMAATLPVDQQNSHNLAKATSHMMKNSEWGATTYLSSSMYGAGVNNVQINSASSNRRNQDQDGQNSSSGATGCGPSANGNASTYTDGTPLNTTTISSLTACSQNTERAYNGSIGQLASTTNNIYGIYDMSGGAQEYTMGNRSTSETVATRSTYDSGSYITNLPTTPYVDIYSTTQGFGIKPAWLSSTDENYYNNDVCTWLTCGGHALHETKTSQPVYSDDQSWGGAYPRFPHSSYSWFMWGGDVYDGSGAGLSYENVGYGSLSNVYGGRAALLPEI